MFIAWTEISEARFDEMLDAVPPALQMAKGFLAGEAVDLDRDGLPRFRAFICHDFGCLQFRYYECTQPMTRTQFRWFSPQHLCV